LQAKICIYAAKGFIA